MGERQVIAAGAGRHVNLIGPVVLDIVDATGRNLPFLVDDEPDPQLRIEVTPGNQWSGNIYNTVSGAAGVPADGNVRYLPYGVDFTRWSGQVGQQQLLNLAADVNGQVQFDQDDVVIPPDANLIRISIREFGTGMVRRAYLTFGGLYDIRIPPGQGVFQCPLYDSVFTFTADSILNDGSDHVAQADTIDIIVTFVIENPVKEPFSNSNLNFYDEDNIPQASVYYFQVPMWYMDRNKRMTNTFTYDYEDDANTAGGRVLFYPAGSNLALPAASGAQPYVSWAFPLGVDVGADRRGVEALNIVHPTDVAYIAIANDDAAKDIDNWHLTLTGVDEQ